eukprot:2442418-Heterocapsa_arctica.AAC.1
MSDNTNNHHHKNVTFQISHDNPVKKKMPIVKKWKREDLGHFVYNDDVLVITGKTSTTKGHPDQARGKIQITIEGTMDSGASNSVAPIEALPGVQITESEGSRR